MAKSITTRLSDWSGRQQAACTVLQVINYEITWNRYARRRRMSERLGEETGDKQETSDKQDRPRADQQIDESSR